MSDRVRGYAHRIDIDADIQHVWRAVTDSASLAAWCSPGATITPKAGGLFRGSVDRVSELDAHIDVFDAPRRLRLIYLPTPSLPEAESAVVDDLMLEPAKRGTIVRILGSGIPHTLEWDMQFKRMRMGWERGLARLKVFVEKKAREEGT